MNSRSPAAAAGTLYR